MATEELEVVSGAGHEGRIGGAVGNVGVDGDARRDLSNAGLSLDQHLPGLLAHLAGPLRHLVAFDVGMLVSEGFIMRLAPDQKVGLFGSSRRHDRRGQSRIG